MMNVDMLVCCFTVVCIGRGVFEAVAGGQLWAFSLGGNGRAEISLRKPAYTNCRVVGSGANALAAWELLTGATPDDAAMFGSLREGPAGLSCAVAIGDAVVPLHGVNHIDEIWQTHMQGPPPSRACVRVVGLRHRDRDVSGLSLWASTIFR